MGKVALISLVLFCVALALPELWPVLVVGAFCAVAGFIAGAQYLVEHDADLTATRAERVSMRTIEA